MIEVFGFQGWRIIIPIIIFGLFFGFYGIFMDWVEEKVNEKIKRRKAKGNEIR